MTWWDMSLGQEDWDVVSFPAIAEEDECCLIENEWGHSVSKRRAGDVLEPERESAATLEAIRRTIGEYISLVSINRVPCSGRRHS